MKLKDVIKDLDGNPRAGISTALPAHFQPPHGSPQRGAPSMPPNMGSQKKYTMKHTGCSIPEVPSVLRNKKK